MATKKIRIEDLANPVLTQEQSAALAYADTVPVELTVDAVLGAASEATGLDGWGPDDFRERLDLWLREMDEDSNRTNLGRMTHYNDCVRYATTRLRTNDLLGKHPEIKEQKIERPIIVAGLPRTGTLDAGRAARPAGTTREPPGARRESRTPD